jgi:hypothetical protein
MTNAGSDETGRVRDIFNKLALRYDRSTRLRRSFRRAMGRASRTALQDSLEVVPSNG